MNIYGQVLGVLGLVCLFISIIYTKRDIVGKTKFIANILFAGQYFCLNAVAGMVMCIFSAIRTLVFNIAKKDKKRLPFFILILFIGILITPMFFIHFGVIDMFAIVATFIYTIGVWSNNHKLLRIFTLISVSLLIGYNVFVKAYPSLIGNIIELLASFIAIYKFDIDDNNRKRENK